MSDGKEKAKGIDKVSDEEVTAKLWAAARRRGLDERRTHQLAARMLAMHKAIKGGLK